MSFDNVYDFFKKIEYKRILTVFLAVAFMVFSPVQTFAAESNSGLSNAWILHNSDYEFTMEVKLSSSWGGLSDTYVSAPLSSEQISNDDFIYNFSNPEYLTGVNSISFYDIDSRFNFEFAPNIYDYYLITSVYNSFPEGSPYNPSYIDFGNSIPLLTFLLSSPSSTDFDTYNTASLSSSKFSSSDTSGYVFVSKMPTFSSNSNTWPVGFRIYLSSIDEFNIGSHLSMKGHIVALPKSSFNYSNILNQIYNELISIDGNVSSIYELIQIFLVVGLLDPETGTSGSFLGQDTETIIGGLIGKNPELDGYIQQYTEVEQSFLQKYTENQSVVSGDFSNWSWGSLSVAVDWTSDYLNSIYDNSGDFRTMFMYPILAGIALIFIGRQGLSVYSRRKK